MNNQPTTHSGLLLNLFTNYKDKSKLDIPVPTAEYLEKK